MAGGGQGVEGWSKKEKGLMDMDNGVIAGGRRLNGNGKNTIQIKLEKQSHVTYTWTGGWGIRQSQEGVVKDHGTPGGRHH